jgi:hypothetical protein
MHVALGRGQILMPRQRLNRRRRPVAELPHKTRFHELPHVALGPTSEAEAGLTDSEMSPRSLREVEAEAVALVCLEVLGLPGADHCRGYIEHWNQQRALETITERCAQRILKAADQILKAGTAGTGGAVMTHDSGNLQAVVHELANALQTGLLLPKKLSTALWADVLYRAISRAAAVLQRLRPNGGIR